MPNWVLQGIAKDYVSDFIDAFQLGPDHTRVGIISYLDEAFVDLSDKIKTETSLGDENDKVALQNLVDSIE